MIFFCNSFVRAQQNQTKIIPQDISECLSQIGNDTDSKLNASESKYLNYRFKNEKGTFDFTNTKVFFLKGNMGTVLSNKKEFFDSEKNFIDLQGFLPLGTCQLIVFDNNETIQTGYNAVIIELSKKYISKKESIKRFKKYKHKNLF